MRKIIPILLLVVLTTVGCSRQPPPHVGEWDAEFFLVGDVLMDTGMFYFAEDGRVQLIRGRPPSAPVVTEGKYKFNYSKNPIQLDIYWNDNMTMRGIVRFMGKDKYRMQIIYASNSPNRPEVFEVKEPFWWLTKRLK